MAMSVVALLSMCIVSQCSAFTHKYCVMLRVLPETGSISPSWIGFALGAMMFEGPCQQPNVSMMTYWKSFYFAEGAEAPETAWTDKELADIAKKCGADAVVAGRYRLVRDQVELRLRIWNSGGVRECKTSVKLSEAHFGFCDTVDRMVVLGDLVPDGAAHPVDRPILASSESFELLGKVDEASYEDKDADVARMVREWAGVDHTSFMAIDYQVTELRADDPGELASQFEHLTKRHPSDKYLWGDLGKAQENAHNLEGARATYVKMLSLDRHNPLSYSHLAAIARKQGNHSEEQAMKASADSMARSWADHLGLGHNFTIMKDYDTAERHLRIALTMSKGSCYVANCLARVYVRQGKWQQAITLGKETLATYPKDADMLTNMGDAYKGLSRYRDAELCYRNTLELDRWDRSVRKALAFVLFKQGKSQEAENECRTLLKMYPKDTYAHKLLAGIYVREKKVGSALAERVQSVGGSLQVALGMLAGLGLLVLVGILWLIIVIRRRLAPDGPNPAAE